MNKKYVAFTSMDKNYYDHCGRAMLRSYKKYWSEILKLFVYNEDGFEVKVKTVTPVGWNLGPEYHRFMKRHVNDKLIAEERMKQFERDVLHWINYDYVVVNNDLNECYFKISNLIDAVITNGSKDYDPDYIRSHVEKLTS